MTNLPQTHQESQDRYGRLLAQRLSAGTAELPYDISERLRAARVRAVAARKTALKPFTAPSVVNSGGAAALTFGDEGSSWGNRLASFLPLLVLVLGLVAISMVQDEIRSNELAEVDAALLTDDLPPAAYTDPGFMQFLKVHVDPAK